MRHLDQWTFIGNSLPSPTTRGFWPLNHASILVSRSSEKVWSIMSDTSLSSPQVFPYGEEHLQSPSPGIQTSEPCRTIRIHPPLGTVIHMGDARPWNVRHNRSIGRDTTLGPLGANLTPQRANHIHVFLGDEARSVIMLLGQLLLRGCVRLDSSCRIRRNERLQKDESRF